MDRILYKYGKVWQNGRFVKADVLTIGNKIGKVGNCLEDKAAEIVDCSGFLLIPGLIDIHVHSGEVTGGFRLDEDEIDLMQSALTGGVTTVGTFVTETAQDDLTTLVQEREARLEKFPVTFHYHLTPTTTDIAKLRNLFDKNCTLKLYTTYRDSKLYSSYQQIEEWMVSLGEKKLTLLIHCEDEKIISFYDGKYPFTTPFDHTLRRPEIAEITAIDRVLELSAKHNYPIHIVHVSTPRGAQLIYEAKKHLPVTCETAPHYLLLNERRLIERYSHRNICTPPLRSETSRSLLLEMAQDGYFDIFATDHCPYSRNAKDVDAESPEMIPSGFAGVGGLLQVLYEGLVVPGYMTFESLIPYLTANPAQVLNLERSKGKIEENFDADFALLEISDSDKTKEKVTPSFIGSHSPWSNWKSSLAIRFVVAKGVLYDN